MPEDERRVFRVVVQRVEEAHTGNSYYSLVVYGNGEAFKASPLRPDDILERLRLAVPSLDLAQFVTGEGQSTHIVFARTCELNQEQLSKLDLTRLS